MRASYLLLRVSDFLEDNEEMAPAEKCARLEAWAHVVESGTREPALLERLRSIREQSPDALVARHVEDVLDALDALPHDEQRAIRTHVAASTRGMSRWIARGPDVRTEADLDDYMHEVAGRVGFLLTDLFALHARDVAARREEMLPHAREFGLGLQTINVIRGLPRDRLRGWIYFPESFVADLGIDREAVFTPAGRVAGLHLLERLVRKAQRHLDGAVEYIELIPRRHHRIRVFCLLPLLFAIRTLALSRGNPRVFQDEVKIGRKEVRRITRAVLLRGWSNRWVRSYAARLAAR